ncbi:MAG: zinc-dependent metalloprotease [Candidatus Cloacimonetes bacterium]|nr:zinc-dependent metalloprotease [Candidatus Cloacimonadota bacterium]
MRKLLGLVLALGLLTQTSVFAKAKKEKPKFPELSKKIKKAKKIAGYFDLYKEDNQVYLEIPKAKLKKEFYLFTSLSAGTVGYLMPNWQIDEQVLYFKKVGKKLFLFQKENYFKAKKGTPMATSLAKTHLDSVIAQFPIRAATKGESKYLIDANSFFFSKAGSSMPSWITHGLGISGVDMSKSFWNKVKGYPKNVELDIQVTVRTRGDFRYFLDSNQLRFHFSIVKKQKSTYKARKADDRIGYFLHEYKNFSKLADDRGVERNINRWNLEKADPSSEMSVVKRPIVYHLDKTIPYKWRKYVRAGVLEWNKAFEKLGFVGAVEARLPVAGETWEPADIRYSTITWAALDFGLGVGPSRTNPKTGEILDADILMTAGWVTSLESDAELFGPGVETKASKAKKLKDLLHKNGVHFCDVYKGGTVSKNFALIATQVSKKLPAKEYQKWKDEFIGGYIKDVVMHEVGHTLGLRHNFKASSVVPYAKIKDPEWLKDNQIFSSVMDYGDLYVSVDPEKQEKYYNSSIGPYDYLAIEYGYKHIKKDEAKELDKVAQKVRAQGLDYGTDEDAYVSSGDPHAAVWDLGDDLVAYSEDKIKLTQNLLKSVEKDLVTTGDSYHKFQSVLYDLLFTYYNKARLPAKLIGGVYHNRDHVNDIDAKLPFVPVSYDKQIKALKFFKEYVFKDGVLEIPKTLLMKARPNPFEWRQSGPVDASIYISAARRSVISQVFSISNMRNISEFHEKVADKTLSLADVFEEFHNMVFADIIALADGQKVSISTISMGTQKYYLSRLLDYALKRQAYFVPKIEGYAKFSISLLKASLEKALKSSAKSSKFSDSEQNQHLEALMASILEMEKVVVVKSNRDRFFR